MRYAEAAFLANYLQTLGEWDARASVRIQQRGAVIGVFGAPPTNCISFVALPLLAAPMDSDKALVDHTVSAGRLRDIIGDVSIPGIGERLVRLPDAVTGPAELSVLPPGDGWEALDQTRAGFLARIVEEATTDFKRRIPEGKANSDEAQRVAQEIWSRPGWSDVPIRALHTARRLGFLAKSDAPVQAAKLQGWARLATPAGQVFAQESVGNLSLRLLF